MAHRRATIVIGAVVATVSAVVATGGAAVLLVLGTDSALTSGRQQVGSPTTALVANVDDIEGTEGISAVLGRPGLRLAANSADPVFIGVGPAAAVDAYLADADIDRVEDLDLDPFRLSTRHRSGISRPPTPGAQTFWVSKSSGTSPVLDWKVRNGNYRVVLMNADASPGVAIEGRFTLAVPHLYGVALAAFIAGLVGFALAVVLVVRAVRRPRRPVPEQQSAQPLLH